MSEQQQPSVDGISEAPKQQMQGENATSHPEAPKADPMKQAASRLKFVLLIFVLLPYMGYIMWSIFLLSILPDVTGNWDPFISFGRMVAMIVGGIFVVMILIAVNRIGKMPELQDNIRTISFYRLGFFVSPGLLFSMMVPVMIGREPPLKLLMIDPGPSVELIAPLSATFSAESAIEILKRRRLSPISYSWDFNGDGIIDEETVTPTSTATFERQGGYVVSAIITLNDRSTRRISKRLVVPGAVFSHTPIELYVDEPIEFSIEHLIMAEDVIKEVQWDFNDDGLPDVTSKDLKTMYTFPKIGDENVSVIVQYENRTQNTYERVLTINEPKPLPFPIEIVTNPKFLMSPPPFQILFTVRTEEPLQDIEWDFGDKFTEVGDRVGHTFRSKGNYKVIARARSVDGEIARVSKMVNIVNTLTIPDLSFDGTHEVKGNKLIEVEAPVTIELMPKTAQPLVEFFWEAPKASDVSMEGMKVKATYRKEGKYSLTLVGQDAEGAVLRLPITINVMPLSSSVAFDMDPQQGVSPLTVHFDASESYVPGQTITGFVWDFGDADEESQRLDSAKVTRTFVQPGTYTVMLKVYTTSGQEYTTQKTIVVRVPFLDACFLMSRTQGDAPLGIRLDRSCSAGTSTKVLWDFGDGSQSDDTSLAIDHVFEEGNKEFTVKLTLEDDGGTVSTFTKTVRTN